MNGNIISGLERSETHKVSTDFARWSDWRDKMIEIGRLCVKIAGRDAGKKAIIIDILNDKYVLIDGETRRRKCNILHIEILNQVVSIEKNPSHEEVAKVLKEIGIETRQTKPKLKTERTKKKRKTPEQLRTQKEEKKKLRDLFRLKKKETAEEKKETTLEEKAGLVEEKKEEAKELKEPFGSELKIAPVDIKEIKQELKETSSEKKEKLKAKKSTAKKRG